MARRTEQTGLLWGRRQRRQQRGPAHRRSGAAGETAVSFAGTPRTRRQGGSSQDRALYACGCGHVFAALVSTSVDCPECGDTQAW
ncbi:MAG: hypothetical protein JO244_14130 [Solirubrobacterales bacterium]|nr:hypothetical protein [Solirubrobacterales bacterium]